MALTSGQNGKAHVLEISNRANIQTLTQDAVVTLTDRIANHESSLNTNAHQIANIFGLQTELDSKASTTHSHVISDITNLQTELDNKANVFTGYTGSIDVVIDVDFTGQTITTKTINISNGIIESIV